MPDAAGNLKGSGWSRARADAWERVFGNAASQQPKMLTTRNVRAKYDALLVRNGLVPMGVPCCGNAGLPGVPVYHDCPAVPLASSPEVPPDCNGCGEDGHVIDDCREHP